MKRVITSLSLLLLLLCGAYAQDISQYEYWTDDDYASRSVVSSSGGNISLDVSTASLSAGIHFLNFRAYRSDGVWGNFYRYLYYIPTLKSADTGNLRVEYWLDDDLAGVKSETVGSGSLSLSIDISAMTPGVHYFNCTPISATGERGNSERYLFYVPLPQDQTSVSPIKGYEYWLDDNYAAKTVSYSGGGSSTLAISIDGLTSGVHYFNCRAFNERGEYGCPVRKMFYIPQTKVNNNPSIVSAEYWLDDDYASKVTVTGSNTQQTFSIDISGLSSGVHYFNYRAKDNEGVWGNITRQMFYIAQKNASSAGGIAEYEYWLDDDVAHKVTGTDSKTEYVFSIDISGLAEGTHTFNFRAKNLLEQWGEQFIEQFVISGLPKLIYKIDGVVYKTVTYAVGETIVPEPAPTKEGYTFSGWSEIPATMPNHDVIVNGSFTINKYKLIYMVDGAEYKKYDVEYGAAITPEPAPTKEGHTFSGWSEIPKTMPTHDVTVTGSFTINKYKLVYKVDGAEYKSYELEFGATITPEPAPTKEGYTFSGWSEIPSTMPAHDVTVTGSFTKGAYKLTYMVDGEVYKTISYDYGATITPEPAPVKDGYSFSGWSEIPATMPAHDVTVTGSFTINKYKLTYTVDGEEYKSFEIEYGASITPEPTPTKEGYTFSGWSDIPETMPAHDVTVTGSFTVNQYTITYIINDEVYTTQTVDYGSTIIPPAAPEREGYDFAWVDYPETMPAYDITIYGTYTTGIEAIMAGEANCQKFSLDGKPLNELQKGVNIVRMGNGQVRKVVVK